MLASLTYLDLSRNLITGKISFELGMLSSNYITGTIVKLCAYLILP